MRIRNKKTGQIIDVQPNQLGKYGIYQNGGILSVDPKPWLPPGLPRKKAPETVGPRQKLYDAMGFERPRTIQNTVKGWLGTDEYRRGVQEKAIAHGYTGEHNGPLDAIRHASAATNVSHKIPGYPGFILSNALGMLHEFSKQGDIKESAMDVQNNFVGSLIGQIPLINKETQHSLILGAQNKGFLKNISKYEQGGYVVKKGDNLTSISKKTGIPLTELVSNNNIKDINKIRIGSTLKLPISSNIQSVNPVIKAPGSVNTVQQSGVQDNYYYNNKRELPCVGKGCAENVSDELSRMGANPIRTDAWFMGDAIDKNKGTLISNNYSDILSRQDYKVGDVITLDRPGEHYQKEQKNNPNHYKSEPVEHVGVIVGRDEKTGKWLVKHGGQDENTVIQPIDDLSLKVNSTGMTLNYKPMSVHRLPNFNLNPDYVSRNFTKDENILKNTSPLSFKNPSNLEGKDQKFLDALNNNLANQSKNLNLSPQEIQQLQKIAYGIFGNESKFGESNKLIPKEILKTIAYNTKLSKLFGDNSSPSFGDTRLKYDDIYADGKSRIGKTFDYLGVNKKGLKGAKADKDYNDEVNATMAILADNYRKLTSNNSEGHSDYNYNPSKNTVFNGVPIGLAIAKMYNSPAKGAAYFNNPENNDYGKNAYEHIGKQLDYPLFPVKLREVVIKGTRQKPGIITPNLPTTSMNNVAVSLPDNTRPSFFQQGGNINDNNGYLTSNLHNFTPKKIINSNHITTQGMAFPIKANNTILHPNTGDYIFNTNKVIETPMLTRNYRPTFQMGGPQETAQMEQQEQPGQEQGQEQQIMQMIMQALQQGMPPEQVMQMLVQQGIPQEQAQQIIQEVMSQMQGQMSQQQPTNDMQQAQPMMQEGGNKTLKPIDRNIDIDPGFSMPSNPNWRDLDPGFSMQSDSTYRNLDPGFSQNIYPTFDFSNLPNSVKEKLKNTPKQNYKVTYQKGGMLQYLQNGGSNGYDAIHPSMYNDMQGLYDKNFGQLQAPTQEAMSYMGSQQDLYDVNNIVNQRKQLAGKYMNNNAYNYTQKHLMNTPQLRRLTNPQTVMANQTYQKGGTKVKQGMVDMSAGWKDFNINPYREQINSNITPQMFKQYEDYYRNYKTDGKISGTDRANAIMIGGLDDNYYKNVSNITGTDMTRLPGMSSGQSAQYAYGDQAFADAYNQYADQRNQQFASNALNEGKVFSDKLNTSRYQNPLKNLAHSVFHRKKYKNEINNINQGLQKSITDYNNYSTGNYEFQDGGMTDAEAKVFYNNPRYVKSLADAERKTFIGPPNYPTQDLNVPSLNDADFGYDDRPVFPTDPNSIAAVTSAMNSSTGKPIPQPSPKKIIKKLTKEEIMKMSNKEFAKIADQRMKTQVKVPKYNTNTNYPITSSSSPTMPFQGDRISGTTKLGNKGVVNTPLGAEDFLAMSTFLPLGEGVNLGLKGLGMLGKYAPNMIKNASNIMTKMGQTKVPFTAEKIYPYVAPTVQKTLGSAPKMLNAGTSKMARTLNSINKGLPAATKTSKVLTTPYQGLPRTFYQTAKGWSETAPKLARSVKKAGKSTKKIIKSSKTLFE